LHGRHHAEPSAFIATPTWISAGVIAAFIFLPLWLLSSVAIATGFSAGFVVAFLWYGIAHHLMHHGAASSGGLLRGIARRHFLHHRSLGYGNFGLTTQCWDRLFGTCLTSPRVNVTR
jgi:sterol desaturase/sphingolipid hydroxylase (fatty acid hydroxylase superfamily)